MVLDKKVKELGKRQHDGDFPSQSEMARISKETHRNLHLLKVLGDFKSADEVISLMIKDLTLRAGPQIESMAKELKKVKTTLNQVSGGQ